MTWLIEPLQYEFIRHALMAGILAGILCPVVGTYLIVQRMSLLGNVLSHAVLPGLVIAHTLGWSLVLGAFLFGMLSSSFITWVKTYSRVKADAVMALILSCFFALGVTLISVLNSQLDLEALLFGDLLSIRVSEVWQMVMITIILLVLIRRFYPELLFFTFDPLGAKAIGLPVGLLNWGLTAAVTLTIVVGLKAVGVILVISLMTGPALTAYLLVKELHWMMLLGAVFGAVASVVGIYLSYLWDCPSGPMIALTVFVGFLGALLLSPTQGLLTQRWWSPSKQ